MKSPAFELKDTTESLGVFTELLRLQKPFHVVKFNDGELFSMADTPGFNCDNHQYNAGEASRKLLIAYLYLKQFAWVSDYVCVTHHKPLQKLRDKIGDPAKTFPHYALLHNRNTWLSPDTMVPELRKFYATLREDSRPKILVCPNRLQDAALFIDTDRRRVKHVATPLFNACKHHSDVKHRVLRLLQSRPNAIVVLCCGFLANLLCRDVAMTNKQATVLDIGSAFDPLFVGRGRGAHYSMEETRAFYEDFGIAWPKLRHWYEEIPGWFNFPDLYREMVERFPSGSRFVEVGAWMGKSAAYLGVEIANSGKNITLDVVDHFKGSEHEQDSAHAVAKKVDVWKLCRNNLRPLWMTQHNTDPGHRNGNIVKIVKKPSRSAAATYEDASLDFVFIDAGHTYNEVRDDIRRWLPKVRPGGVLAGHDYTSNWPGVVEAVKDTLPGHEPCSKCCWRYEVPA